jgi:hypothetical protein
MGVTDSCCLSNARNSGEGITSARRGSNTGLGKRSFFPLSLWLTSYQRKDIVW